MKQPILPGDSGLLSIEMPARIARLPKEGGVPVPFFLNHQGAVAECVLEKLCWVCGVKLGAFSAFVTGAVNGVTRIATEPPCHLDCAKYTAAVALSDSDDVTMVWVGRAYEPVPHEGGMVFKMGTPVERLFFKAGRTATPEEIADSLRRGLPVLRAQATAAGGDASAKLKKMEAMLGVVA